MLFHTSEIHTVEKKFLIKAQYPAPLNVWELIGSILKTFPNIFCKLIGSIKSFSIAFLYCCIKWGKKVESEIQLSRLLQK